MSFNFQYGGANLIMSGGAICMPTSGALAVNAPTGLAVSLMGQETATGSSTSGAPSNVPYPNYTQLTWNAPVGNTYPTASYQIWRSVNGGSISLYDTSIANLYNDYSATLCVNASAGSGYVGYPANTYAYYVKAVDTQGNISAFSTQHVFNIYLNGYNWAGDFRNASTINYNATDPAGSGNPVIEVTTTSAYGETLTYSGNLVPPWNQWVGAFNYMYCDIYTTQASQSFGVYAYRAGDVHIYASNGSPIVAFDPASAGYGPAYVINTWQTYKWPLSAMLLDYGPSGSQYPSPVMQYAFYKWSIQSKLSSPAVLSWYMRNIVLSAN